MWMHASVISRRRLHLYSQRISLAGPRVKACSAPSAYYARDSCRRCHAGVFAACLSARRTPLLIVGLPRVLETLGQANQSAEVHFPDVDLARHSAIVHVERRNDIDAIRVFELNLGDLMACLSRRLWTNDPQAAHATIVHWFDSQFYKPRRWQRQASLTDQCIKEVAFCWSQCSFHEIHHGRVIRPTLIAPSSSRNAAYVTSLPPTSTR